MLGNLGLVSHLQLAGQFQCRLPHLGQVVRPEAVVPSEKAPNYEEQHMRLKEVNTGICCGIR